MIWVFKVFNGVGAASGILMRAKYPSVMLLTSLTAPHDQLTYRDAANITSRLMAAWAASICWNSAVLPITLAASLTSLRAHIPCH